MPRVVHIKAVLKRLSQNIHKGMHTQSWGIIRSFHVTTVHNSKDLCVAPSCYGTRTSKHLQLCELSNKQGWYWCVPAKSVCARVRACVHVNRYIDGA